ncbi:cytochrome c [Conexibacter arvalis]|uniref:Mono/diheme cytochrome c family protein n=1 Tax=Conexibacter arvalis TaxID=912552 RepID=A0A840IGK9_9ACTN|nr:cytochrome c [Conexibacter arvalis]MBB4664187.1 mono/diheme cytochrome c family protein [Conexibacter arvalis]
MLATAAFIAFWVIVGLVLFLLALRGGPRGMRATLQSQSRAGNRTALIGFSVFYIAVGVAVPVLLGIGNSDSADAHINGQTVQLTQQEREGRELFGANCANCHTLAAARASGQVGPSLDVLRPPAELTYDAIVRGRQRGGGTMPARLLEGSQAEAVAAFVAATAGR